MTLLERWKALPAWAKIALPTLAVLLLLSVFLIVRMSHVSDEKVNYWKGQYEAQKTLTQEAEKKWELSETEWKKVESEWVRKQSELFGEITSLNGVNAALEQKVSEAGASADADREAARNDIAAAHRVINSLDTKVSLLEQQVSLKNRTIQLQDEAIIGLNNRYDALLLSHTNLKIAYDERGKQIKVGEVRIAALERRVSILTLQVNLGKVGVGVGLAGLAYVLLKK